MAWHVNEALLQCIVDLGTLSSLVLCVVYMLIGEKVYLGKLLIVLDVGVAGTACASCAPLESHSSSGTGRGGL